MRTGLTRRQADLLKFIDEHNAEHGYSPSYSKMADALGLRSKSGIHRMIEGLEERGHITRLPNRACSITLVERDAQRPTDLEIRISAYCRAAQIDRSEFARRAAEGLLRGWA